MEVAIIVVFLAVFFSYSVQKGIKSGLEIAFFILTVYWAIRYDFGNDYMSYLGESQLYLSNDIDLGNLDTYRDIQSRGEYGWVFLIKLFEPIGFFGLIIVLSIFECFTIYWHIKKYVPNSYYWLATALYCLNINFMMIGASMLRQWLAICICLWAFEFINKKKLLPFVLLVFAASTVHTASLIVLPAYLLVFSQKARFNRNQIIIILLLVLVWSVLAVSIMSDLWTGIFINERLEGYSMYLNLKGDDRGIIGLVVIYALSLLPLSYLKEETNPAIKLFSVITVLNIIFVPISSVVPLITRTGLYFFICSIITFPAAFVRISKHNKALSTTAILLVIAYYSYTFIRMFSSPIWHDSFIKYHTIFSVPWQ